MPFQGIEEDKQALDNCSYSCHCLFCCNNYVYVGCVLLKSHESVECKFVWFGLQVNQGDL